MIGPTVWTAILADPVSPFDPPTLRKVVHDQQRWSRRYLHPPARVLSRCAVFLIVCVKRLLPAWRAHSAMDQLCVWFLRNFVSAEAGELLIRHFLIETNLLNFVIRNAGVPGIPPVSLRPIGLRDLGNRAVIEHDVNVYKVLVELGVLVRGGVGAIAPPERLDMSMLDIPPIDAEPARRRWLNLDIQTALCFMNIPFALCLTPAEYQRAVHSLRLDEPLMALLAEITSDVRFLRWRPAGSVVRVDSTLDVPRAVYEHAVYCEHAHALLLALDAGPKPSTEPKPSAAPAAPPMLTKRAGGTPDRRAAPRPPSEPSAAGPSSPSSWPATG
jgi:Family of unknown function (DUF6999)